MSWRGAFIVFAKEMRDILRDRRTVVTMVLVPILLYPVISVGIGSLIASQVEKTRAADYSILVLPRNADASLRSGLKTTPQLGTVAVDSVRDVLIRRAAADSLLVAADVERVFRDDPRQIPDSVKGPIYYAAVAAKVVDAVCELPSDFEDGMLAGDSLIVGVFYDETDIKSESAGDRLRDWAIGLRDSLVDLRLEAQNLDRGFLEPFWVLLSDIAPPQKKSGFLLAMMLPYMLMILTMTGGMYPALDITAGEKERNTLETLLAAPVARWHLAIGKFMAVGTAGFVTMILATASMTLSVRMSMLQIGDSGSDSLPLTLSGTTVAWVIFLMIPMAILFSSVLIAVAISARSYKEGQSYVTPLIMGVILPAMVSFVPGVELEWGFTVVPVVNLCLALKEVLLGIHQPAKILAVFAVTALYAAFALFVATRMFQRESVLFRT
jgi:sodium transport system permease protein